jgi:solute carrier family 45, member 1/2/4
MIVGSIFVMFGLLLLGWTREFVGIFTSNEEKLKSWTVIMAVLSIYLVDFAINAVQWSCRSLIVDTLPIPKQQLGSAWASRMSAVGHMIGYAAGTIDLVGIFGKSLGDTQFKKLILIAIFGLLFCVSITSAAVVERVLISSRESEAKAGIFKLMGMIFKTATELPRKIQAICWVVFWSWIGWFPFLFYSTTWVGETYFRYNPQAHDVSKSEDALGDVARIGSLALVLFSVFSLVGSIVLPWVVKSPEHEQSPFTQRPPPRLAQYLKKIQKLQPDLLAMWTMGCLGFSASMILAPFTRSYVFATILVTCCGLPWAITQWAPFALMGEEINKISHTAAQAKYFPVDAYFHDRETDTTSTTYPMSRLSPHSRSTSLANVNNSNSPSSLNPPSPPFPTVDPNYNGMELGTTTLHVQSPTEEEANGSTGELAGIYLGILNLFTTMPQFLGTFISMIVFNILEPGKSPELSQEELADDNKGKDGVNAIAVCLFIGACSTLGAAYATTRLRKYG